MKAAQWIDRVKVARGWDSDYRAAKELGLSKNTISNYRVSARTLDEETSVKVASALGEKPDVILLDQAMERSKTVEGRSAFGRALKRLGGAIRPPAAPAARGGSATGKGALNITKSASDETDIYIVSSEKPRPLAQLAGAIAAWLTPQPQGLAAA